MKKRSEIINNRSMVNEVSGVYYWYIKTKSFKKIFPELPDFIKNNPKQLTKDQEYVLVYVGIANNLRERLLWHLDQKHTLSAIRSGFLSTLRQSLSAIAFATMANCDKELNDFFEKNLLVKWVEHSSPRDEEKKLLIKYILPLNIQGNKREELKESILELRRLRKKVKLESIDLLEKTRK
ncbi:MAG: hypothetical protein WBM13_01405 [Bacteroidia bacterium]